MTRPISREQATHNRHVVAGGGCGAIAVIALAIFGINMARPYLNLSIFNNLNPKILNVLNSKIFNITLGAVGAYSLLVVISYAHRRKMPVVAHEPEVGKIHAPAQ